MFIRRFMYRLLEICPKTEALPIKVCIVRLELLVRITLNPPVGKRGVISETKTVISL